MPTLGIEKICVVGAGIMGAQIALQCALHGYTVALTDVDEKSIARGMAGNREQLERRVAKGRIIVEDMEQALAKITATTDLIEAAAGADIAIEAVYEQVDLKREVFARLDRYCPPHAILASNASTIVPSDIARDVVRKDKAINTHFFNPPLVMELVEVVKGPETSEDTVEQTMAFCRSIGRTPVLVRKEIFGFLVNRIHERILDEAFWLVENGYTTVEDLDLAIKLGLRHPMGPFELADHIGLDALCRGRTDRYQVTGDENDKPSRLLVELVERGDYGRKTGKGFYDYR